MYCNMREFIDAEVNNWHYEMEKAKRYENEIEKLQNEVEKLLGSSGFVKFYRWAKKAAKNKSCKLPYKLAYSQECGHEHNTHTHISNQSVTLTKFLHEQERLERTAPSRLTGEYSDYSWGHHSHQYVQLVNNVPKGPPNVMDVPNFLLSAAY